MDHVASIKLGEWHGAGFQQRVDCSCGRVGSWVESRDAARRDHSHHVRDIISYEPVKFEEVEPGDTLRLNRVHRGFLGGGGEVRTVIASIVQITDRAVLLDDGLRLTRRRWLNAEPQRRVLEPEGPDLSAPMSELLRVDEMLEEPVLALVNRRRRDLKHIQPKCNFAIITLDRRLRAATDAALAATIDATGIMDVRWASDIVDLSLIAGFAEYADRGRRLSAEIEVLGQPPQSPRPRAVWDTLRADVDARIAAYNSDAQDFLDARQAARQGVEAVTDHALDAELARAKREDTESAAVEDAAHRIQAISGSWPAHHQNPGGAS